MGAGTGIQKGKKQTTKTLRQRKWEKHFLFMSYKNLLDFIVPGPRNGFKKMNAWYKPTLQTLQYWTWSWTRSFLEHTYTIIWTSGLQEYVFQLINFSACVKTIDHCENCNWEIALCQFREWSQRFSYANI